MERVGNLLLTVTLHAIATFIYNDTEYALHDVTTEFDCTS